MNTLFSDWLRGVKFWLYNYGLTCVAALPAYYFFSIPAIRSVFSDMGFSFLSLMGAIAMLGMPIFLFIFFGVYPCLFLDYIIKRITKKETTIFSIYDDNPWEGSPWGGMFLPILISYPVYFVVFRLLNSY